MNKCDAMKPYNDTDGKKEQVRAMFPQFCGISGSTSTIFSMPITPVAVASDCFLKIRSSSIVRQTGGKINRKNC